MPHKTHRHIPGKTFLIVIPTALMLASEFAWSFNY